MNNYGDLDKDFFKKFPVHLTTPDLNLLFEAHTNQMLPVSLKWPGDESPTYKACRLDLSWAKAFTCSQLYDCPHSGFSNTQAYATSEPIVSSKRTINFLTGIKVRVLGTNTFLSNTYYMDEEGLTIQALEENIKNGQDITTMQYGFDGRL